METKNMETKLVDTKLVDTKLVELVDEIVKTLNSYIDMNNNNMKFILAKMDELDKRLKRVEENLKYINIREEVKNDYC